MLTKQAQNGLETAALPLSYVSRMSDIIRRMIDRNDTDLSEQLTIASGLVKQCREALNF